MCCATTRGATTLDITSAKLAVCKDGYNALVYGRPVSGELAWLLMQARSRTPRRRNAHCSTRSCSC